MATATILRAWSDGTYGNLAAVVTEPGGDRVEYIGRVPLSQLADLTNAQKKAALVAAVKAVRDAQATQGAVLPGMSGDVTV